MYRGTDQRSYSQKHGLEASLTNIKRTFTIVYVCSLNAHEIHFIWGTMYHKNKTCMSYFLKFYFHEHKKKTLCCNKINKKKKLCSTCLSLKKNATQIKMGSE